MASINNPIWVVLEQFSFLIQDACLLLARRAHRPLFPRDLDSDLVDDLGRAEGRLGNEGGPRNCHRSDVSDSEPFFLYRFEDLQEGRPWLRLGLQLLGRVKVSICGSETF